MIAGLYFSEAGMALVHLVLALSAGSVLTLLLSRDVTWHRAILFGIAVFLTLRYLWWRAAVTIAPLGLTWDCLASWSFFAGEAGAAVSSINAFVLLSRTRDRREEATAHSGWWGKAAPRVSVLIATYNEDKQVLERTVVGALAVNYPNVDVLVLDDGRREWLREFCATRGVRYIVRPDREGAKAGNMNHALGLLAAEEPPDFVTVLDADFVPHRNFLSRSMALFHDPQVGLVQTPQHFFNADPIQHNLDLSRSYPDEQRFFFDQLQPARDAWGIAFCCGTSSVVRWDPLAEIGGFPTESVTEDFMLTLALQERGHRTVYLNEPLSEGLAPEGLKEYITQRTRWCLGLMQIARSRLGPLGANALRLRDRWSVADSVIYWTMSFSFRLAAFIFPLLYWFFNVIVVSATVPDVLSYFGVYFVWSFISLNFVSGGLVLPVVNDVSQLLSAWPVTRAAWTGLLRPRGYPHPFSVTAKGGDRSSVAVQWRLMMPFLILFALTSLGLVIGIFSDRFAFDDAGDGKIVILSWSLYNFMVLAVAIIVCIEVPRRERHLDDKPERGTVRVGERELRVWIVGLTQNSVRIRGAALPDDAPVKVSIAGVGWVRAIVTSPSEDGAVLLLEPTMEQHDALLRRFYSQGDAPGIITTRYRGLLSDLAHRFSA